MTWNMTDGDDWDGIQYDTEYAPSAAQLEAEQIRRECYDLPRDDCSRVYTCPHYPKCRHARS